MHTIGINLCISDEATFARQRRGGNIKRTNKMKHILKCLQCGKYTMKETCNCGGQAATTKPGRYAPDKYGKYRREARKEDLTRRGLL